MIVFSIIGLVCCLVLAMYVREKSNSKKDRKRRIENYRRNQLNSRLYKWREKYSKWKEELKKPVKVQFD